MLGTVPTMLLCVQRLVGLGCAMLEVVAEKLHDTDAEGLRALQRMVDESHLPQHQHVTSERLRACDKAVALLRRTQPSILSHYVPVSVLGDGNCLFRSVSLFCYGSDVMHCSLRARAAAELLLHPDWYDQDRADSRHPLRGVGDVLLHSYEDECLHAACLGEGGEDECVSNAGDMEKTAAWEDECVAGAGDIEKAAAGEDESVTGTSDVEESVPLQFMAAEQLVDLLSGTEEVHVNAEVPRGVKKNVWFVVDNSGNIQRRKAGKKNVYWDDCGVWSTKDGRTLTTNYVRIGNLLSVVKLQDGKVCKRQMVQGKRKLVPLEMQPEMDDIVTVCSYYATLKADSSYRKRVSWIVSKPNWAVYEYQGTPPPVNGGHGLQRKTETEFVRTKPQVLENIRAGLGTTLLFLRFHATWCRTRHGPVLQRRRRTSGSLSSCETPGRASTTRPLRHRTAVLPCPPHQRLPASRDRSVDHGELALLHAG